MFQFLLGLIFAFSVAINFFRKPKEIIFRTYKEGGPGAVVGQVYFSMFLPLLLLSILAILFISSDGVPYQAAVPVGKFIKVLLLTYAALMLPVVVVCVLFMPAHWRFTHITAGERVYRKKIGADFIPESSWKAYELAFYLWNKEGRPGDFYEWYHLQMRKTHGSFLGRKKSWLDEF